jgi:hypothetical protein
MTTREYDEWTVGRVVVDTSGKTADECLELLLVRLMAPEA